MQMKFIENATNNLAQHPLYPLINNIDNLRIFMEIHVFAVWDFMTLLKSLQQRLTSINLPWIPSKYPSEIVRFINEIVIAEESDIDRFGGYNSHFAMYLLAMDEIQADTSVIRKFLNTLNENDIPPIARPFVKMNLKLVEEGSDIEVAACFLFGREKLIPQMFTQIVNILEKNKIHAPDLLYYLERHIHIDEKEHGPLAQKCLNVLCGEDKTKLDFAYHVAIVALEQRKILWDNTLNLIIERS